MPANCNVILRKDKSFVYDLNVQQGIVSSRVALLLRSAEIKPSLSDLLLSRLVEDRCLSRCRDFYLFHFGFIDRYYLLLIIYVAVVLTSYIFVSVFHLAVCIKKDMYIYIIYHHAKRIFRFLLHCYYSLYLTVLNYHITYVHACIIYICHCHIRIYVLSRLCARLNN